MHFTGRNSGGVISDGIEDLFRDALGISVALVIFVIEEPRLILLFSEIERLFLLKLNQLIKRQVLFMHAFVAKWSPRKMSITEATKFGGGCAILKKF